MARTWLSWFCRQNHLRQTRRQHRAREQYAEIIEGCPPGTNRSWAVVMVCCLSALLYYRHGCNRCPRNQFPPVVPPFNPLIELAVSGLHCGLHRRRNECAAVSGDNPIRINFFRRLLTPLLMIAYRRATGLNTSASTRQRLHCGGNAGGFPEDPQQRP